MATASDLRNYKGPALLSYGFRPLFLLAALQAGVAVLVWLPMATGAFELPTAFAPVDWHIHEMLFGYLAAAVGGFLLTAIPNWTGRLPVHGAPLLVLVLAWLAGRIAITFSALIGWPAAMVIDCAYLALLAGAAIREIVAGKNWRNLKIIVFIALLWIANLAFHIEAHFTGTTDYSRRLGIGVMLMLVGLIGGRVIPSFTRNWLAQRQPGHRLPVPFGKYDKIALAVTAATLLLWLIAPDAPWTGAALLLGAALHTVRLARWAGERTWRNPLLAILHVAYIFVPLGFILSGLSAFGIVPAGAGIHAWTAGGMGTITLAVMTRASLGHSGLALVASRLTICVYALVIIGALARICSALGHGSTGLLHFAGLAWAMAFIGFTVVYWRILTGPRPT